MFLLLHKTSSVLISSKIKIIAFSHPSERKLKFAHNKLRMKMM